VTIEIPSAAPTASTVLADPIGSVVSVGPGGVKGLAIVVVGRGARAVVVDACSLVLVEVSSVSGVESELALHAADRVRQHVIDTRWTVLQFIDPPDAGQRVNATRALSSTPSAERQ